MWIVWTFLGLVVFCLALSMVEEVPAALRRRPGDPIRERRPVPATAIGTDRHFGIMPAGNPTAGAAFSSD
jgi:hypothetical protein